MPLPASGWKIFIVGGSGAGKTHLRERIASITGLPSQSVDQMASDAALANGPAAIPARLAGFLGAPAWVFEGWYHGAGPVAFARADLVIWLDMPLWLRLWRVIVWSYQTAHAEPLLRPSRFLRKLRRGRVYHAVKWQSRNGTQLAELLSGSFPAKPVLRLRHRLESDALAVALAAPDVTIDSLLARFGHQRPR